ncbi:MAG: insulinase family protein [Sphingopyxis sp.]|nr:insulinase family protein [Sphingopyxis sp.]
MSSIFHRRVLRWIAPVLALGLIAPAPLPARESASVAVPADDWLYAGSDIPRDAAWTFGTLPNGLRFAVRDNGVPPGQVAIRVRIDVGSLYENDDERGYAHLLEHLAFRGSVHVPDGEARRIWQRFGVTFGSDSNAQTTPTQTVYQLDLPSATPATLDEGMKLLAGMIREPRIVDASVDAERAVVLAEMRESDGPQQRIGDQMNLHFFAGQRLAGRSPIGTPETLQAARARGVADFHRRYYRPENAVVAIVGDGDPAGFAALIKRHFGDWRSKGQPGLRPPFGDPDPAQPAVTVIAEPAQARSLTLAAVRPWRHQIDTIAYTRQLYLDFLATALINRRFERSARSGGTYLVASAQQEVISRSADITTVQVVPAGDNWQGALRDVRAVIAAAVSTAPSQTDIDREANEIGSFLQKELDNERNEPGARLADDLVRAVDIGETVTSPAAQVSMFAAIRASATPEVLLDTTRKLFTGPVERLAMVTPVADSGDAAALAAALTEPVTALAAAADAKPVTMADLPALAASGSVSETGLLPGLNARRFVLSNGVVAVVSDNRVEPDKVRVNVRFGHGARAMAPDAPNLLWSGDFALAASGVGTLGQNEIDELTNGRQIQLNFAVEDNGFEWSAETRPADLADQLRLIAAKLAQPGWDPAPVERLKLGLLTGYDQPETTPGGLIERDLVGWLRANDRRWKSPSREEIAALTPAAFRAFWEPLLRAGPIEVQLFGDLRSVDVGQLLAETLGTLQPETTAPPPSGRMLTFPVSSPVPQVIKHKGNAGQAAALLAWRTGGGIADIRTARQLDVLAAIFNDRLFERLRAQDGASYGPIVASDWPTGFDDGGYLLVGSLLAPKDLDRFYQIAGDIVRELASEPVSADELTRASGPIREQIARALTGNLYWMHLLEGASRDPRVVRAALSIESDAASFSPGDIQSLAQRYFIAERQWALSIVPPSEPMAR